MSKASVIRWLKILQNALVEIGTEAGVNKGKIGKFNTTRLFDLAMGAKQSIKDLKKK